MKPAVKKQNDLIFDPVCGMDVTEFSGRTTISHKGETFYFCGEGCLDRFKRNPEKFQGEPLIKLSKVWKIFKMGETETQVLRGVDLHIWERDFISIIGASGSGKSTLLNMIGLLDKPTSGRIFLRGKDITLISDEERAGFRTKIFGFVFQQYNLIPWLTAYENVTLPLIFSGGNIDAEKLEAKFEEIGIKERMTHRPTQLSGGEQQRLAFLRALVNNPQVVLGDEPTGNLDSATGNKLLELLINLNRVGKKTLIIVTHDADIAEKADEIITIKDGQIVPDHRIHKRIYTEHEYHEHHL